MKVPAEHLGQDRLVSLLQELQRLPRKIVPWLVHGKLINKEFWNLKTGRTTREVSSLAISLANQVFQADTPSFPPSSYVSWAVV